MAYNCMNHKHRGGDRMCIGGELRVKKGGKLIVEEGAETEGVGGGLPAGGAPYQQLVTDGAGNTVWTDRLAYAEHKSAVIIPETVAMPVGEGGSFEIMGKPENLPIAGGMYTVTYNGVEYECEGYEFSPEEGISCVVVGDMTQMGMAMGNGEPFAMVMMTNTAIIEEAGAFAEVRVFDGAESVTIAIRGELEVVKKIDEKYLPNTAIREPLLINTVVDTVNKSLRTNLTQQEIFDDANAGRDILLILPTEKSVTCAYCNPDQIGFIEVVTGDGTLKVYTLNKGDYEEGTLPVLMFRGTLTEVTL